MIVAVLGDVHGNLSGMYRLCEQWQKRNRQRIKLVLQTGDMGLFGSAQDMDRATRKHFAKDETELDGARYLDGRKKAPIVTWFVHGNHENFELLRRCEDQAVDAAGRIIFLGPGLVRQFKNGDETLRVAALGGMEYRFGKHALPSQGRIQKYLYPPALEDLLEEKGEVDVLLLHDAPLNKGLRDKFPTGSKRITELVEKLQPKFVFYGHYDNPPEPFQIGESFCAGMNIAGAKKIPARDGAMGIVQTDTGDFDFVR